jgi:hypothetical protein
LCTSCFLLILFLLPQSHLTTFRDFLTRFPSLTTLTICDLNFSPTTVTAADRRRHSPDSLEFASLHPTLLVILLILRTTTPVLRFWWRPTREETYLWQRKEQTEEFEVEKYSQY